MPEGAEKPRVCADPWTRDGTSQNDPRKGR